MEPRSGRSRSKAIWGPEGVTPVGEPALLSKGGHVWRKIHRLLGDPRGLCPKMPNEKVVSKIFLEFVQNLAVQGEQILIITSLRKSMGTDKIF